VNNPITPHRWAWVWLLLAVGFAAEGGRYIYLTFYQEDYGELFRSKITGLAFLGIPLTMLCLSNFFLQRRTQLRGLVVQILVSVTLGLGLCFLGVGIFDIFESWPEPEKSLQPSSLILITLGFVGYPLGVLLVAYRYWSRRATMTISKATISPCPVRLSGRDFEFDLPVVFTATEPILSRCAQLFCVRLTISFAVRHLVIAPPSSLAIFWRTPPDNRVSLYP
jgi:hypothetical protein